MNDVLASIVRYRKVGGIHFYRLGPIGGSFWSKVKLTAVPPCPRGVKGAALALGVSIIASGLATKPAFEIGLQPMPRHIVDVVATPEKQFDAWREWSEDADVHPVAARCDADLTALAIAKPPAALPKHALAKWRMNRYEAYKTLLRNCWLKSLARA